MWNICCTYHAGHSNAPGCLHDRVTLVARGSSIVLGVAVVRLARESKANCWQGRGPSFPTLDSAPRLIPLPLTSGTDAYSQKENSLYYTCALFPLPTSHSAALKDHRISRPMLQPVPEIGPRTGRKKENRKKEIFSINFHTQYDFFFLILMERYVESKKVKKV